MHSLLEQYMVDVAERLGPLPLARREEELREVRAHLENAIAAGRAIGLTEDETTQKSLEQFGPPDVVGADAVATWQQGERKKRARYSWGMTALFTAAFGIEGFLRPHVIVPMLPIIVCALFFFVMKRLVPRDSPAWWILRHRPTTPAQCWLSTAALGAWCLLYLVTVPQALTQAPLLALLAVAHLCYVWVGWLWGRRRGGDPTGPVPGR